MPKTEPDKNYALKLGEAIRLRREQLDMSQTELARIAMFHRNWIGRVERGQVNLTVWCLMRIAGSLDTTPDTLLPKVGE